MFEVWHALGVSPIGLIYSLDPNVRPVKLMSQKGIGSWICRRRTEVLRSFVVPGIKPIFWWSNVPSFSYGCIYIEEKTKSLETDTCSFILILIWLMGLNRLLIKGIIFIKSLILFLI